MQAKGLRQKINSEWTGSGELTKTEHRFFLQLRRSFCALPKACVHRNRFSLTIKVGKQENRPRRRQKKSVTSDNGDGGPTLSIAIAVREGSTDKQDFAFDKSCSHTKRWTMAFFVRVAFESTSRTRVVPVACGSTTQSSFTSMAFGGQRNRSGYDVDCHCQTKLLRHVLEQPLPVKEPG